MSNILVLVEHTGHEPKKASLAAITFGQQTAQKGGGKLNLLVIGSGVAPLADKLKDFGATKVYVVDHASFANHTTEGMTAAIVAAAKACDAKVGAAAASSTSKDVLPRVAARLEAGMASDVIAVIDATTFKRPMWAGNVVATVQITTPIAVCTIRSTEFGAPSKGGAASVESLSVAVDLSSFKAKFVSLKVLKNERPELTSAARVVTGGRGAKGPEGFKLIEQLADTLGAAVGASRAACDAGWVANDLQVGQTGKIIAPDLYIGVGISGAIQHLAGMKGSKVIVAINKDAEAPIFQVADYGLVADMFKAVPELIDALKKS